MAICRICGSEFKITVNSGNEICSNPKCWKKAWRNAVAPLCGKVRKKYEYCEDSVGKHVGHTMHSEDDIKRIIELFKAGTGRKEISEMTGVPYSTVCGMIKKYT